jgi:hypothetical protein
MYSFGNWINNINYYSNLFNTALPYEHCIIDNFFDDETFKIISKGYPDIESTKWDIYNNPIEKKLAYKDFESLPIFNKLVSFLQSDKTLQYLKQITSINDLENDPHLHGAGIHCHKEGMKLDLHLDYSIHPISSKERRLNLIIFLNEEWHDEWNGALEFWNRKDKDSEEPGTCIQKIFPKANRAVLFRTSDISIHGVPEVIKCPVTTSRKTFAIYYMSNLRKNIINRPKAKFFPKPGQPISNELATLYSIRKERRIEDIDLQKYPNWEKDPIGRGYWY